MKRKVPVNIGERLVRPTVWKHAVEHGRSITHVELSAPQALTAAAGRRVLTGRRVQEQSGKPAPSRGIGQPGPSRLTPRCAQELLVPFAAKYLDGVANQSDSSSGCSPAFTMETLRRPCTALVRYTSSAASSSETGISASRTLGRVSSMCLR